MNALRVEAYLRSACSVLNFDVGELWTVRENPGKAPSLHFIQLYTSPLYEDFHNILIRPSKVQAEADDEQTHQFSPIICRGVCDGGQIVWANTKLSNGLIGRNDLPLNTAVGVPICSVGMDLCILVLFAVESIQMTTSAIDFFNSIARAASEQGNAAFLPSSISSIVTRAQTEQFVGVWDMLELVVKYSKEVDFHLLPIDRLQKFFDYQEQCSLLQLFDDFRDARDGRFDPRQLQSLHEQHRYKQKRQIQHNDSSNNDEVITSSLSWTSSNTLLSKVESSDDLSSQGVTITATTTEEDVSDTNTNSSTDSTITPFTSSTPFSSSSSPSPPSASSSPSSVISKKDFKTTLTHFSLDILYSCGIGAFSVRTENHEENNDIPYGTINNMKNLQNILRPLPVGATVQPRLLPNRSSHLTEDGKKSPRGGSCAENESMIDGRIAYRKNSERFHEFIVAMIGMTAFEAVELWLYSDIRQDLYVVCAVHDHGLQPFTAESKHMRLQMKQDMAGHCMHNSCCYWDHDYNQHSDCEEYPRAALSEDLGIKTAFGVPLPGPSGACGVFVLYSREKIDVDPLMVTFVEVASQLLSASALDPKALAHYDIESWTRSPKSLISDWVDEENNYNTTSSTKIDQRSTQNGLIIPQRVSSAKVQVKNMNYSLSDGTPESECLRKRALELSAELGNHDQRKKPNTLSTYQDSMDPANNLLEIVKRSFVPNHDGRNEICTVLPPETKCDKGDCQESIAPGSQFCNAHTNSRRCLFEGCTKCAQGKTPYCISHGGGRRCTVEGCFKAARDKFFCAGHGGGKRCSLEGCSKAAVGGSGYCTKHGGGKRCQEPGCTKSSQASTNFCVRHGGGRKCIEPNCNKAARSRTDHCASHGSEAIKR